MSKCNPPTPCQKKKKKEIGTINQSTFNLSKHSHVTPATCLWYRNLKWIYTRLNVWPHVNLWHSSETEGQTVCVCMCTVCMFANVCATLPYLWPANIIISSHQFNIQCPGECLCVCTGSVMHIRPPIYLQPICSHSGLTNIYSSTLAISILFIYGNTFLSHQMLLAQKCMNSES